ncbi:MAG: DUF99 family protein [Candidatus Methanosuratus sp.]|nr:DUF99 family protein [Candidatus Methanosuratincola sp.]
MPLHLNKPALRALGIAESFKRPGASSDDFVSINPSSPENSSSMLAGVVMRADRRVDGLAFARARVGGDDATEAVLELYRQLDRKDINALLLGGAVISWFNIIDLDRVFSEVARPLICLTYEESSGLDKYLREYFPQSKEKIESYQSLGRREKIRLKTGYELFVRVHGATIEEARILLNRFTLDGRVPEPVRLARMAARAARKVEEGLASGSEV